MTAAQKCRPSCIMMYYICTRLGAGTSWPWPTPTNSTISVHNARSLSATFPRQFQPTWPRVRSPSRTPLGLCPGYLGTYKWRRLDLVHHLPILLFLPPSRVDHLSPGQPPSSPPPQLEPSSVREERSLRELDSSPASTIHFDRDRGIHSISSRPDPTPACRQNLITSTVARVSLLTILTAPKIRLLYYSRKPP